MASSCELRESDNYFETRENMAKPNSDYDNCFKQSKKFKINNKLSFAGQTFKKEKTRLSLTQIMIIVFKQSKNK